MDLSQALFQAAFVASGNGFVGSPGLLRGKIVRDGHGSATNRGRRSENVAPLGKVRKRDAGVKADVGDSFRRDGGNVGPRGQTLTCGLPKLGKWRQAGTVVGIPAAGSCPRHDLVSKLVGVHGDVLVSFVRPLVRQFGLEVFRSPLVQDFCPMLSFFFRPNLNRGFGPIRGDPDNTPS